MAKDTHTPHARSRYPRKDGSNVEALPGIDIQEAVEGVDLEHIKKMMPDGMTVAAQDEWVEIGPALHAAGRLNTHHRLAFAQMCDLSAEIKRLTTRREKRMDNDDSGYSFETEGRHGLQIKAHPEISQLATLRSQLMTLFTHFGITPVTETKLPKQDGTRKPKSPFKK